MLLAYATKGRSDTTLLQASYTLEELFARLSVPRIGNKDGSYYIRGGKLRFKLRSDENLIEAELLITDGDSRFEPETGEILPGAPPIDQIIAALKDIGFSFIIHTSFSCRPADGFWKYRVVFPCRMADVSELQACNAYILDQLHVRGVYIADVRENCVWSQPWYLPRIENEAARSGFVAEMFEGERFDVAAAVSFMAERLRRERKEQVLETTPPISRMLRGEESPIQQFNKAHGIEWVRGMLSSHGYKFIYVDKSDGSYRYMRPGSETKTAGVKVFLGAMGDWCCYSHHGAADPLSGKVTDPFALFATFEHGGDLRAALKAIRPPEKTIAERITERITQRNDDLVLQAVDVTPGPALLFDASTAKPEPLKARPRIDWCEWSALADVQQQWLVKNMVPSRGLTAMFGKSGAGKSFFALYVAAMIAAGREAFEEDVDQGDVIYLAMEGAAGLRRRRDALIRTYRLPDSLPMHFVRNQLNFRSSLDDADAFLAEVEARGVRPKAIIIDTLARAFAGGEENSAAEMGQFVSVLGYIEERLRCAVIVVHHSGKDESRGMRGSSALRAACDAEIEIIRMSTDDEPEPICQVTTTKQKDGMDEVKWTFRLALIQTSDVNPDATSLVVEPLDNEHAPQKQKKARTLSPNHKRALEALRRAINERGEIVGIEGVPSGQKVVHTTTWLAYFITEYAGTEESARRKFQTTVDGLWTRRTVCNVAKYYWIADV